MISIYELSALSNAVYEAPPSGLDGWTCVEHVAGGSWNSFQAAAFTKGRETVVAFRGTAAAADVLADLKLGTGMNTSHFSAADDFVAKYAKAESLSLCGHSLGGAIAQIAGNRSRVKFATFNAPGVAVLASRNILDADPAMLAIRVGGAAVSMFRHPFQAARDIGATFNVCKGVNMCLRGDVVSQIGVHYGKVIRIPGTGWDPLAQHGIGTVMSVLENSIYRQLGIADLA